MQGNDVFQVNRWDVHWLRYVEFLEGVTEGRCELEQGRARATRQVVQRP